MNFGSRPRGRSSNFEEALTSAVGKLASVIFQTPVIRGVNSPSISVELRGKYLQQLKELINLRDIGALTENEYEEHRSIIVDQNLMRNYLNIDIDNNTMSCTMFKHLVQGIP